MAKFPFSRQAYPMSCGPTCLRMIASYYGKELDILDLISDCKTTKEGATLLNLSTAAENIGFKTTGITTSLIGLQKANSFPCIAFINEGHYVVIYKVKKNNVYVADPIKGLITYNKDTFIKLWRSRTNEFEKGIILLLKPKAEFYTNQNIKHTNKDKFTEIRFFSKYLKVYRKLYGKLIMLLIVGSIIQLGFPFLTQNIIDIGIKSHDINIIYLLLLAQLMLFLGKTTVEVFRGIISINVSSRLNITLVNDFFTKLMKLPIAYFDTKSTGIIMQRIYDNQRIEQFLSGSSLKILLSSFNIIVFGSVLAWYNFNVFLTFLIGSIMFISWTMYFLKRRAALDHTLSRQFASNNSKIVELLIGMQDIKLNNAEEEKRLEWKFLQIQLFRTNIKSLILSQTQNSGASLINELKNIFILFLSAKLVIESKITLGVMLSISFIIGQLNVPILDIVYFIQQWQNAKLSLGRLSEIYNREDEITLSETPNNNTLDSIIRIKDVSFSYDESSSSSWVLKNVSFELPKNKITAIVGESGSGKTTLLKLLLKYYKPTHGTISIGTLDIKNYSAKLWREKCGVIMQDGYVFTDTIANNIALGNSQVDLRKLTNAIEIANLNSFIDSLPLGYHTKIGVDGLGLSTGQKQRILIARAVYKNPEFLFFDEATSALDTKNEKKIMDNIHTFSADKTVVIVAHRLSTVKNADNIIVLNDGIIAESGPHDLLVAKKGIYFSLIKNQLELEGQEL